LQLFKLPPSANLALVEKCKGFHWSSLSKLNNELNLFPWTSGETEVLDDDDDDVIVSHPISFIYWPTTNNAAKVLASKIVQSSDRLFFIFHEILLSSWREWQLVRVHFEDSTALRPTCLTDGDR
jgi:hypothetical protein